MKNDSWLCLNVISPKEKKSSVHWFPESLPACLGLVAWCSAPVDTEITFFQPSKHVMSGRIMSYGKWLNGMWHRVTQHRAWPWERRRALKGLSAAPWWLEPLALGTRPGSNVTSILSRFPYSYHVVLMEINGTASSWWRVFAPYELGRIIFSVAETEEDREASLDICNETYWAQHLTAHWSSSAGTQCRQLKVQPRKQ